MTRKRSKKEQRAIAAKRRVKEVKFGVGGKSPLGEEGILGDRKKKFHKGKNPFDKSTKGINLVG